MIWIWKVFGLAISFESEQIPSIREMKTLHNEFCQKDIWHEEEKGLAVNFYIK
jgi:hypothetical protein